MSEPSDPPGAPPPELTGRIGKYEIKRAIGKGAMGRVYLAHDTVLDRDVALKVMAHQIADDPELKVRFEREARAVARMTHPNVVTVFDLGTHTDGSPYIAMEWLEGRDLQKAVRQPTPLSVERKVAIIVQVLAGLAHAHQQGIVHRDIKPANIFIVKDDTVKIMDFGVARLQGSQMTETGNVVGTADYMSPEQVRGDRVDGRSDLFSVGCLLFELITGRRPFAADNLMAVFYKITHEGASLDLFPPGVAHDALLPIVKKALAGGIEERYQTAAGFAVDLREWLRAHATTASSQSLLEALVGLEAPAHAPPPVTEAPRATVKPAEAGALGGATVDLGAGRHPPRAPRKGSLSPTHVSGRTLVGEKARPGASRAVPPPLARRRGRRVVRRNPLPWVALFAVVTVAVAGLGYVAWRGQRRAATPPATSASPVTQAPAPTLASKPSPPPLTAASQPPPAPSAGQAPASVRAATAAFDRGAYDRAIESAQTALREDPSNAVAREILGKAENGQKAAARIRAGEAALSGGNLAVAEQEARAARGLAPWDRSVVDLTRRIDAATLDAERSAAAKARRERAARVGQLIEQGTDALAAREYAAAIAAYDEALALDPGNSAAVTAKSNAITARTVAESTAGGAPAPVRALVASGSVARGVASEGGRVPSGFEDTPGVDVHPGSQAAALPGDLVLEASPPAPQPGERYSVFAHLVNEGSQPIELETMVVTTTIDGKKQQGRVSPSATVVAPRQRALVFQLRNELWKQGTRSWEMEIVVYTSRRETYRNSLVWK